jgi:hypothetical protein
MASRGVGKLARARIVPPDQPSLLESPAEMLLRGIRPGLTTERYGRVWHLGQTVVDSETGFLFGRLGFESTSTADLWDPEAQDFLEGDVPGGVAAPFVIRLRDLVVVFQVRGQDIRVMSFTGALRRMLSEATDQDWKSRRRRARSHSMSGDGLLLA